MLQHGSPLWTLLLFGAVMIPLGLCVWHRLGSVKEFFADPSLVEPMGGLCVGCCSCYGACSRLRDFSDVVVDFWSEEMSRFGDSHGCDWEPWLAPKRLIARCYALKVRHGVARMGWQLQPLDPFLPKLSNAGGFG